MKHPIGYQLWLDLMHSIPRWELVAGMSFFALILVSIALYQLFKSIPSTKIAIA
jgi:hypothetical protein